MKRNFYFSLLLSLFSLSLVNAQILSITDEHGKEVNGDTIYVLGNTNSNTNSVGLKVSNVSGSARTFNVKRYETEVISGSKNSFCFGICFTDLITGISPFVSNNSQVAIPNNDYTDGFHAFHYNTGKSGLNKYRYVFFDVNNTSDSVFVDIFFNISADNSVVDKQKNIFSLYLNSNKELIITNQSLNEYLLLKMKVYNVLSQENLEFVFTPSLLSTIDLSHLKNGMYMISLQNENKILSTHKIVIVE